MVNKSKIRGVVAFSVRDKEGNIIERVKEENLVVDGGRQSITALLASGDTDKIISKISFGTSDTAATVEDTSITSPFTKAIGTATFPDSKSVRFAWSLGLSEANGKTIMEIGLLTADDTLFSRKVRNSPIVKTSDIQITDASWTLIFE
jgi:hypothetical protein